MWQYNNTIYPDDELYHYGVKGMKWGVRRTRLYVQTDDRPGNSYSDREKESIKKRAQSILKNNIRKSTMYSKVFDSASKSAYNKADKLVWKSEKKQNEGDQAGFEKYQSKALKQMAKYYTNKQKAEKLMAEVKDSTKKLKDIDKDLVKAGKDYVTNTTVSTNMLLSLAGIPNIKIEEQIDFKKKS